MRFCLIWLMVGVTALGCQQSAAAPSRPPTPSSESTPPASGPDGPARAPVRLRFGESQLGLLERAREASTLPGTGEITAHELLGEFSGAEPHTDTPSFTVETSTVPGEPPESRSRIMRVRVDGTAEYDGVLLRVFFPDHVVRYRLLGYDDQSYRYRGYLESDGKISRPMGRRHKATTPQYGNESNLSHVRVTLTRPTTVLFYEIKLSRKKPREPLLAQLELTTKRNFERSTFSGSIELASMIEVEESSRDHREAMFVAAFAEFIGGSYERTDIELESLEELVSPDSTTSVEFETLIGLYRYFRERHEKFPDERYHMEKRP